MEAVRRFWALEKKWPVLPLRMRLRCNSLGPPDTLSGAAFMSPHPHLPHHPPHHPPNFWALPEGFIHTLLPSLDSVLRSLCFGNFWQSITPLRKPSLFTKTGGSFLSRRLRLWKPRDPLLDKPDPCWKGWQLGLDLRGQVWSRALERAGVCLSVSCCCLVRNVTARFPQRLCVRCPGGRDLDTAAVAFSHCLTDCKQESHHERATYSN